MVKNDPSKPPKWANFWQKISIFGVINGPLELKMHPKVGLLRPKTMPKQFLNNSKKTLKKSRKRLFRHPKWPNHGCQLGQKCRFWGPFSVYELYFWVVGTEKKLKSFPLIAKDIKKKKKFQNSFLSKKKYEKVNTPSQNGQITVFYKKTWPKVSILKSIFGLRALFLARWHWKKN